MSKNPALRSVLVLVLPAAAFLLLACVFGGRSIATRIFGLTTDTTGGTRLLYEIDTKGFTEKQKKGLSERMIRNLRRRLDPSNMYNLVWLPHGSTRIELQVPLPGPEVRQKWLAYEKARSEMSSVHVKFDEIALKLIGPKKERAKDFREIADGSAEKLRILNNLGAAFDRYLPFAGLYDPNEDRYDPESFRQMLKGVGKLEFRVLPTIGHPKVDTDQMNTYIQRLKEKGPQYASDLRYIWCQIKNIHDWKARDAEGRASIVAGFGDKEYVLASNQTGEAMVHEPGEDGWRVKNAELSVDNTGRRAVHFTLDERGGRLFADITGKNINRPLCILLDGIAMSAPVIQSRISREGVITGRFTLAEIENIVNELNAGCLPARLIDPPVSVNVIERNVSPDDSSHRAAIDDSTPN
jgi:preprotein translocase subunit SecD